MKKDLYDIIDKMYEEFTQRRLSEDKALYGYGSSFKELAERSGLVNRIKMYIAHKKDQRLFEQDMKEGLKWDGPHYQSNIGRPNYTKTLLRIIDELLVKIEPGAHREKLEELVDKYHPKTPSDKGRKSWEIETQSKPEITPEIIKTDLDNAIKATYRMYDLGESGTTSHCQAAIALLQAIAKRDFSYFSNGNDRMPDEMKGCKDRLRLYRESLGDSRFFEILNDVIVKKDEPEMLPGKESILTILKTRNPRDIAQYIGSLAS